MGCGTALVKYIVFFFNLLFLIVGLALIVVGSVFLVQIDKVIEGLDDVGNYIKIVLIVIILVGCIVFIISFCGCCGAIKENICMISTYGVILLIIFLLQVGIGTYALITFKDGSNDLREEITNTLNKNIKAILSNPNATESQILARSIDYMQEKFTCCGSQDKSDWGEHVPKSCCVEQTLCVDKIGPYFNQGCVGQVFEFFNQIALSIAIVVFTIAAVELGAAIVAFCLCSCIRNNNRRQGYY